MDARVEGHLAVVARARISATVYGQTRERSADSQLKYRHKEGMDTEDSHARWAQGAVGVGQALVQVDPASYCCQRWLMTVTVP